MVDEILDQELLERFVRVHAEEAFQSLVKRHVDLVYATALRQVTDSGLAEEVTQNVFIVLARKAAFLPRDTPLGPWLYKTALLEARYRLRTEVRRRRREQAAGEMCTTMKDQDSLARELLPVLDEGLLQLREIDRHALLLRFLQQKSLREVGMGLGVSEDTARKRVDSALEKLTLFFRTKGYAVPTIALSVGALTAAAKAAPSGLAAAVAQAALPHAASASLIGLSLALMKLMSLTKIQTVTACVLLSAAPIAFQWHAFATEQTEQTAWQKRLDQARELLSQATTEQAALQANARILSDQLNELKTETARQKEQLVVLRAGQLPNPYLWSESSPFVRIPKTLVNRLRLTESESGSPASGEKERRQKDMLDETGRLSPVLVDALGITPAESDQLQQGFADWGQQLKTLQQNRLYLTNTPPAGFFVGNRSSLTAVTPAFPAEAQTAQSQIQAKLELLLGKERAETLWRQGEQSGDERFTELGIRDQLETVAVGPGESVTYWRGFRPTAEEEKNGTHALINVAATSGSPTVPEVFQSFIAQAKKPSNP